MFVEDWTIASINRALIRYAGFRVYGCREYPMNRLDKRVLQQRRTRHILAWIWQQNRQAVDRNVGAPFFRRVRDSANPPGCKPDAPGAARFDSVALHQFRKTGRTAIVPASKAGVRKLAWGFESLVFRQYASLHQTTVIRYVRSMLRVGLELEHLPRGCDAESSGNLYAGLA